MPRTDFDDFVGAAIRGEDIEKEKQKRTQTRRLEEGGPSQGPAKRGSSGTSGSASSTGSDRYRSTAGTFGRGRSQSWRRGQSHRQQSGASSSGSSGSRFQSTFRDLPLCRTCNRHHCGQCQQNSSCFVCGQVGHYARDCPRRSTQGGSAAQTSGGEQGAASGARTTPATGQAQQTRNQRGRPAGQARVHAMTLREGRASPEVVIGTLFGFGYPVLALLDLGAMHSFISHRLTSLATIPASPLPGMWHVTYPSGEVESVGWVYLNCEIFIEGYALAADLMLLDIVDFDLILDMDFLEAHWVLFDCHKKKILFRSPGLP